MRLTHRRAVFTYKTLTRSSLSLAGRQCVPETRSTPAVIECVCMCATPVTSTNARRVPLLSMLPHFDLFFGGKSLCTRFVFTVVFCVCVYVRCFYVMCCTGGSQPQGAQRACTVRLFKFADIRTRTRPHTKHNALRWTNCAGRGRLFVVLQRHIHTHISGGRQVAQWLWSTAVNHFRQHKQITIRKLLQ